MTSHPRRFHRPNPCALPRAATIALLLVLCGLAQPAQAAPRGAELEKGVAVPVNLDDLEVIGATHVTVNLVLRQLLDLQPQGPVDPAFSFQTPQGIRAFRPAAVRQLDRQLTELNRRGMKVTAVVLNAFAKKPAQREANSPLLHPQTDLEQAPHSLGAFNLTTAEGRSFFDAFFGYVARRYGRPDSPHGHIDGYIVGNEINSHWIWHNLGEADEEAVAQQHAEELTRAWRAASAEDPDVRIYTSLDHVWSARLKPDPLRFTGARFLLDRVAELTDAAGGVPWHVAFHPYPSDLRDPRFWDDPWAMFSLDTPRMTFKNLEVLADYLDQPRLHTGGEARRVILSEQGFHAGEGVEGEDLQAAAYALAWERIRRIPGIDAFIYHRHVDHRGEGGLKLGLWDQNPDAPGPSVPLRPRPLHGVFAAAGTSVWPRTLSLARRTLPREAWELRSPRRGPFREVSPTWSPRAADADADGVLALARGDLAATVTDALAWKVELVEVGDGLLYAIFHHPPRGGGVSTATFRLPTAAPSSRPASLRGGVGLKIRSSNGVRFSLEIGDETLWTATRQDTAPVWFNVPLDAQRHFGKDLVLRVDGLQQGAGDQALWIDPLVTVPGT